MMYEEFVQNGAKGEISEAAYLKVEDVYTAYNRFDSKKSIADFWNKHGEEGIDAMMAPLDGYRALKSESNAIDKEIAKLENQIAALNAKKAHLAKKMKAVELQCDLSWHWAKYAR